MVCFINKNIINFGFRCRKWSATFKFNICTIVCNYFYISCSWNKCVRIITKTRFNTFYLKFNRIDLVVFTFCCLTVYNIPFFDSSSLESFNKFIIFCASILYDTEKFSEKLNLVSSDFLMMKNIVALSFSSSLPIKLICCFKSGFSNSMCLPKSSAISL